jgi:hypothetical protein
MRWFGVVMKDVGGCVFGLFGAPYRGERRSLRGIELGRRDSWDGIVTFDILLLAPICALVYAPLLISSSLIEHLLLSMR